LAPFAIRLGMDIPVIDVAQFARCTACGTRRALLQRPTMEGVAPDLMLEPFPAELACQGMEHWFARNTRTRLPAPMMGH
jgi:hypothetical protein